MVSADSVSILNSTIFGYKIFFEISAHYRGDRNFEIEISGYFRLRAIPQYQEGISKVPLRGVMEDDDQ